MVLEAFFEIDSHQRRRSVYKLRSVKAQIPGCAVFWIYYGSKRIFPYPITEWDYDRKIGLIEVNPKAVEWQEAL